MCGIVGILHFDETSPEPTGLRRMLAAIRYRGPDECGIQIDGPAGLGHVRLSIIDLAAGHQPMQTADGSLTLVYNGEIFNYVELREELRQKGHRFTTQSDTEVVLHAYAEYGEDCVSHFNGQWAFAIWDRPRGRLFLSRDRLGIRPLYYTVAGNKFLFASEVKSLFTQPEVRRAIDPRGLNQLFTLWSPLPPRTIFEGVSELPPGHNLVVANGVVRSRCYWTLEYGDFLPADEDHLAGQLLDLLADATRLRLRSDVPVGAYLSGGLDSSVNAALVKQWTDAHLRTFSVTFEDEEYDESRYQQDVVRMLGTDHQSVCCRKADIGRVFPEVIRHTERPVLRTAPAPLFVLSKLVRQEGYKVVLTGEGADEILGGYDLFKEAKVRRFWAAQPGSRFRALLLEKLYPYLPNLQAQSPAYLRAFFHAGPEELADPLFSHLPRWELTSRLKAFFSPELASQLAGHDVYAECRAMLPARFAKWDPFCQAQYLETTTLLPGYILSSQGDRMAMAHSVEGRYPMLDYRLAEFAARVPPRLKMKALDEKHLLKRAARGLVPQSVLRRNKQPYRAPEAQSFFTAQPSGSQAWDYVEELLSPRRVAQDGLFQSEAVEHLVRKIRGGFAIGVKDNMAFVGILSTQLVVEQFINHFSPADAHEVALSATRGA